VKPGKSDLIHTVVIPLDYPLVAKKYYSRSVEEPVAGGTLLLRPEYPSGQKGSILSLGKRLMGWRCQAVWSDLSATSDDKWFAISFFAFLIADSIRAEPPAP
jgi:hypothetical protein